MARREASDDPDFEYQPRVDEPLYKSCQRVPIALLTAPARTWKNHAVPALVKPPTTNTKTATARMKAGIAAFGRYAGGSGSRSGRGRWR